MSGQSFSVSGSLPERPLHHRPHPLSPPRLMGGVILGVVRGIALADYASYLDERATFLGQWGLKGERGDDGVSYEELVETEGRPRLRMWLERGKTQGRLGR